jgi:GT2 family glycosyltransferase
MAALFSEDTKPLQVEAVIGACMLMKRSTFEQIGMFSEDYFMYGEDIDLCYKISKAGYRNYYIPSAAITHHGGKSSASGAAYFRLLPCGNLPGDLCGSSVAGVMRRHIVFPWGHVRSCDSCLWQF